MFHTFRCFVVVVLSLLTLNSARAIDLYWDNQSGAMFPFYTEPSFWSTDPALTMPAVAAPLAGDNIFFLFDTSPYSVILSSSDKATNVTASNGDVSFTGPSGNLASSGVVMIDDPLAAGLSDGAIVTLSQANWDNVGDAIVGDAGFGSFILAQLSGPATSGAKTFLSAINWARSALSMSIRCRHNAADRWSQFWQWLLHR